MQNINWLGTRMLKEVFNTHVNYRDAGVGVDAGSAAVVAAADKLL